jgi:MFS family permease
MTGDGRRLETERAHRLEEGVLKKGPMFYRFALYGFLKNLRFFEPFLLLFFRETGLSFFQIGLLYSVRDLGTNLLEVPAGVYADAFGRRRSMVLSFLAYIASFVVFYLFSAFYPFALAMLLFAVGEAFRSGTHKALILEYLKLNDMEEAKVAYYGRTRAASQLGSALNSLIAAGLVFYSGSYRYIFIASLVPYLLDLVNLATYPPELDGELASLRGQAVVEQVRSTTGTFLGLFRDPAALRSILNSASFQAFFKSTKEYLQPILEGFALSLPLFVALEDTKRSAVVIGVVYFVIYLLTSYASRSSEKFGQRFKTLPAAINLTYVAGGCFLLAAGATAHWELDLLSIFIFLLFYVLYNLRKPMNVAFISDQISSRVMAAGLSVESQFATVLVALLAPLLGALADGFGVGTALAVLGALMGILAIVVRVEDLPRPELSEAQG